MPGPGPTPARDALYSAIESARLGVARAQSDYSAGRGTVEKVNAADRKLIDAHAKLQDHYAGTVPER